MSEQLKKKNLCFNKGK